MIWYCTDYYGWLKVFGVAIEWFPWCDDYVYVSDTAPLQKKFIQVTNCMYVYDCIDCKNRIKINLK